ncbi:MAG: NifU family protein [Myxococcales bacterium]|nr:NifU family protein [Myxococcales bacterium]
MSAELETLVGDLIRPLIEADGGSVEIVLASRERIVLHLGRACSGCPGVAYTTRHVIEPLIRQRLGPSIEIEISNQHSTGHPRLSLEQGE